MEPRSSVRATLVAIGGVVAGLVAARETASAICPDTGTGTGTGTGTADPNVSPETPFEGCGPVLPVCSSARKTCCYRSFQPVAPATASAVIIPLDRCHQTPGTSTLSAPGLGSPDSNGNGWCGDPVGSASAGGSSADDGMFQAYGLVYRLLQNGIPVHWVINPTKDPPTLTEQQNLGSQVYTDRDIDFWVLSPGVTAPPNRGQSLTACTGTCVDPVRRLSVAAAFAPKTDSYNYTAFPVRGSAFVIAPEHRARFDNFIKRTGEFASHAGDSRYDFSAVDMYAVSAGAKIVYQDYRNAAPPYPIFNGGGSGPVAFTLDFKPPRLARQSPAGVSALWLAKAKLDHPASSGCATGGAFTPADAVYCDLTRADVQAGRLVAGNFSWAWLDNWNDNSPCGSAAEIAEIEQMRSFMTAVPGVRAGGSIVFMQAIVDVVERCDGKQVMGRVGNATGLVGNNQGPSEPLILRRPSSLFMQWGDIPTSFASGSPGSWYYTAAAGSSGYDPAHTAAGTGTLIRLVTEDGGTLCTGHKSTPTCDVFSANSPDALDAYAYLHYADNISNGLAVYLGGNQVTQSGNAAHLRAILDSFLAVSAQSAPVETTPREVSRSSPIVATVGGVEAQYQGTLEVRENAIVTVYENVGSNTTFEFPFFKGHLRAFDTSRVTSSSTAFEDITPIFDAADDGMIPPAAPAGCSTPFTGACRTVFTTTKAPDAAGLIPRPPIVFFDTSNRAALKPFLGAAFTDTETSTLISRVLAGVSDCAGGWVPALGGIDHSTMAVIEDTPLIAGDRPTMIYVGALDGMLHAICAERKGACDAIGRELWAYIPRTQLGKLSRNTQRVDGSPVVADVLDDFDGDGSAEYRTVLVFQTGWGEVLTQTTSPALIALDISDPTAPTVLWERVVPSPRLPVNLGIGLVTAMGPVRVDGVRENLVFVQTNNGGTGASGYFLGAYRTADGAERWTVGHIYPDPRTEGNPTVPTTGIPGGVAAFDATGTGDITTLAVPSLYGDVWLHDAATGANPRGTLPLFRFASDYHPIGATPAVYRDLSSRRLALAIADGGYVDPVMASWTTPTTSHFAIGVAVDASPLAPVTDTGVAGNDRLFKADLGVNQRVFASPVIAGEELLVVTDTTDANLASYGAEASSASLRRFLLDTGESLGNAIAISGGASSVDAIAATGVVFVGSGAGAMKVTLSSTGGGGAYHPPGDGTGTLSPSTELPNQEESVTRLLWLSR